MNLFSKGGVYDATETGEAFREPKDRHVAALEGGTVIALDWARFRQGPCFHSIYVVTAGRNCSDRASALAVTAHTGGARRHLVTVGVPRYRAIEADHQAWESALRPQACLLALQVKLQKIVASKLILDWSPEQISGWPKNQYSEDESMRVSQETIYRSLFI